MIFGIAWFVMIWFGLILAVLIAAGVYVVRRNRHAGKDTEAPSRQQESEAHQQVLAMVKGMHTAAEGLHGRARVKALRNYMDSMSDGLELASEIRSPASGGPRGEWVIAPGAKAGRRILYIHGGAWIAGSPRSHRAITDRLSHVANACVFAVDYRLMPENLYMDGIRDCQRAYGWLLENGPEGKAPADFVVVAGDSAGGSHTLGLIAWIRDQGLRAPNAAIAMSPSTELILSSLGSRANLKTDVMLGPTVKKLSRIPPPLLWWGTVLGMRVLPSSPKASPLRGKLHNLPPTLIHVSESEILLENAERYAAKARAAGSPVEIETWPDMVHVWHLFTPLLPEAEEAFEHIREFLSRVEAGST